MRTKVDPKIESAGASASPVFLASSYIKFTDLKIQRSKAPEVRSKDEEISVQEGFKKELEESGNSGGF